MVVSFNRLNELVEFPAQLIDVLLNGFEHADVGQGAGFMENVEVIRGLVAGRLGIGQEPNEILFVPTPAISLDDVRSNGFNGPPNLSAFFVHFMLWKHFQSHVVDFGGEPLRQSPNLELAIAHWLAFRKQQLSLKTLPIGGRAGGSSIEHRVSSINDRPLYLRQSA